MNEVEAYIQQFSNDTQEILRNIRKLIKDNAPNAEELLAYGMPAYKTNQKPLVYFAAFKKHIGFYATPSGHIEFEEELSKYKQGKGSVQFPLDQPMPYKLIERIVQFRVIENNKKATNATKKTIGKTKDTGWVFGVRKTVPLNTSEVWDFLFSSSGEKFWLNDADKNFSTFKNQSHIRTKWKLKNWTNQATLQMRVIANKDKTTIAFHIERLLDENQRKETKDYWDKVIKIISEKINPKTTK